MATPSPRHYSTFLAFDWYKAQGLMPASLELAARDAEQVEWRENGIRVLEFTGERYQSFICLLGALTCHNLPFTAYSGKEVV
jgi:hypothetical protein